VNAASATGIMLVVIRFDESYRGHEIWERRDGQA
jgi:hypothetical protein